jgi:hypothetical protein
MRSVGEFRTSLNLLWGEPTERFDDEAAAEVREPGNGDYGEGCCWGAARRMDCGDYTVSRDVEKFFCRFLRILEILA